MRLKQLLFVIFIVSVGTLNSQDKKFFDTPFGGGGGYTPGWYFPNLNSINQEIKSLGIPELSESGFYSSGGAGFVYIGFVDYLRLGGMGFGGSTSQASSKDANGFTKEVNYSLSGGGLTVEYSLPFIRNIAVSVGFLFGAANIKVDVYNNNGNFSWDDVWTETENDTTQNINRSLNNNFFIFSPTLNVDIPLNRFISFRIGGGYQITFGDDWKVDNDQEIKNVPSDLNGNTFFLQSGIFIGFFSF
ncbi:MAG TPA: hypothetical protein VLN45_04045 [Ignavibacteriaceae bacterium]|nr:hypothetical protein [Ignavibacteriaceae bacterium]